MKKLFVLSLVVFSLGVLVSCGGSSSNTTPLPEKPIRPEVASSVTAKQPSATAKSSNGEQTVDVAGKTCLPVGTYKVTSKDLTEAAINTICSWKYQAGVIEVYPGDFVFESLSTSSETNGSDVKADFAFSTRNCEDCPRDYLGKAIFHRNPLGEWQLLEKSGGFKETPDSIAASKTREVEKTEQAERDIFSGVKIEVLVTTGVFDGPRGKLHNVQVHVEGHPHVIYLLGQVNDGRVLEFESEPGEGIQSGTTVEIKFFISPFRNDITSKSVEVLAYSFRVGQKKSDWVYLNR